MEPIAYTSEHGAICLSCANERWGNDFRCEDPEWWPLDAEGWLVKPLMADEIPDSCCCPLCLTNFQKG